MEALRLISAGDITVAYTKPLVARFDELTTRLEALTGVSGRGLIDALFPDGASWAEPFRGLTESADEDIDAEELRDQLRTAISQPELPLDVDYVRVMSLHKSKGLTADLVVVAGCIQGLIPYVERDGTTAEKQRLMEEQRRLFYVVLTRTRKTLVLSSIKQLPRDLAYRIGAIVPGRYGRTARTIASSFLPELGSSRPRAVPGAEFLRSQGLGEEE